MTTRDATVVLEEIELGCCGVAVAYSADFLDARRRDHKTFYCPNGHARCFLGKSDVELLREKLEVERSSKQFWCEQTQRAEEREATAERRRRAARAVATKLKKRISEGKCPACKHIFPDVSAHIAEEHPGYGGDA